MTTTTKATERAERVRAAIEAHRRTAPFDWKVSATRVIDACHEAAIEAVESGDASESVAWATLATSINYQLRTVLR